jgi:hypothetical protein
MGGGGDRSKPPDGQDGGADAEPVAVPPVLVGTVLAWEGDAGVAPDSFRIAVQVRLVDAATGRSFWRSVARCAVPRTDSTATPSPREACLERLTDAIARELVSSKRPAKG